MSEKKHILVVSQCFYPEQFRINDICCEWIKRGYKVTALTGIPNYPKGDFYPGYGLFRKRHEVYEGIDIIRIPVIPRKHGSIMLALNYMSFVVSGFFWKLFAKIKCDRVFIFETSPMTQALIGVWYAKRRHIPCYMYVQDLWPDNVEIITGIHNRAIIGPIGKMCNYIYKNCTKILVTSPSFKQTLVSRNVSAEKVVYWPQYAEDFYKPSKLTEEHSGLRIMFTGNIGKAQGLEVLPEVAKRLKDTGVSFHIVGDGRCASEFKESIVQCGVENMFVLYGRKKPEEISDLLATADVAFISFMQEELFTKTIPAKLQSYMACGMPVLAAAEGETERVIKEAACGWCCKLGDIDGLEKTIRKIITINDLKIYGNNAQKYSEEHFDKNKLLDQLDAIWN